MREELLAVETTIEETPAWLHTEAPAGEATGRKRDLGGAVVLAAIQDYRGLHEEAHLDAGRFLYPRTAEWQAHFDWVVSMAEGVDKQWLREALDRQRDQWDGERLRRQARRRAQMIPAPQRRCAQ